jgi:integration host factor subunit beta
MTKAELVERVAEKINLTKKQTEMIVNILFNSIIEALSQGDKVELRGFGSFRTRHRNPREGRNPKTGDAVHIPAKQVPFFKAGKELREMVDDQ